MEINEDGFIEELLSLRRETAWGVVTTPQDNQEDGFVDGSSLFLGDYYVNNHPPGVDEFSVSSLLLSNDDDTTTQCAAKPSLSPPSMLFQDIIVPTTFNNGVFSSGTCHSNGKNNKVEGQPSKNLMAERRRRKRLNDRLAMLRSVVPKISKMDRTSILGDTIDYMKELLERINNLKEDVEVDDVASHQFNVVNIFKDSKPNDLLVRNTPKFDVERRKSDTRVELCCPGKPGLLLSTINTLEALGLEVQQCVISCFNDFSLHASCHQVMEHGSLLSSEDIKQALFRNAGYGGRCS